MRNKKHCVGDWRLLAILNVIPSEGSGQVVSLCDTVGILTTEHNKSPPRNWDSSSQQCFLSEALLLTRNDVTGADG
jgi:hypothetical protein